MKAKYYIEIDLHKVIIQVCVLNERGETLEEFRESMETMAEGMAIVQRLKQWSTDGRFAVEADGPLPGVNSMLSFGSAAYLADKTLVGTFSANLETLPDAKPDPDTMEWWKSQPEAWKKCRKSLKAPQEAMTAYLSWLKELPGIPVFVGYPAAYDFLFVYWYLMRFTGESPFSHSALDIKTYAMAMMKSDYRKSTKKQMPKRWFDKHVHTHIALDDAIEQGALFCNMLAENKR